MSETNRESLTATWEWSLPQETNSLAKMEGGNIADFHLGTISGILLFRPKLPGSPTSLEFFTSLKELKEESSDCKIIIRFPLSEDFSNPTILIKRDKDESVQIEDKKRKIVLHIARLLLERIPDKLDLRPYFQVGKIAYLRAVAIALES